MRYTSTRDKRISIAASEAIVRGISRDGGLFVPEELPKVEDIESMAGMDYKEIAYEIMHRFLTDFEPQVLMDCIDKAYDDKFIGGIVPVRDIEDIYFLELFHGPTLAFKDMALSILPYLLREAMRIQDVDNEIVILTATSGDTGKAALEGFANVKGIKIVVFYPEDGVSEIQKLQMLTQKGDNTFVIGIEGNFDDAQDGVKRLFNDEGFINMMDDNGFTLSSANSINIGRLIPQIVYYFYGYLRLRSQGRIEKGEKINVIVPTGNFGNILAAYYGKQMGIPIDKLISASNENNILSDFINTGIYDARRELILTSSPSMDILVSSNLERLLFHLSGEDANLIGEKMAELSKDGFYKIEPMDMGGLHGYYSKEEEVGGVIRHIFDESGYLMDPHTAVAYNVYRKYRLETGDDTKTLISATASPFKFGAKVAESIGMDIEGKDQFTILEDLASATNTKLPQAISALKGRPIVHKNNCNKEDMRQMVEKLLGIE